MLSCRLAVLWAFLYYTGIPSEGTTTKHILLHTPLLTRENWHLKSNVADQSYFQEHRCLETNCIITSNRTYLPQISHFDVIAMNSWNINSTDDFPPAQTRHPDQLYVIHFRESPIRTKMALAPYSHYFNWTMSFRLDGDIFLPYGHFVDRRTKMKVAPALNPGWQKPNFNAPITRNQAVIELVEKKPKIASWLVSSCFSPSQRKFIVKKMEQYMPIDIYGKCGTMTCSKGDYSACRSIVELNYKFYLSFENSLCTDYITEKVFSMMKYYIIPVVYGGADYTRFLPPHSYINVLDFESVEDLVEYLHYLANNTEEYMKYFWWKDYYRVVDVSNMCGICEKIVQVRERPSFTKYYRDIDEWFKNGTCTEPKEIPLVYKVLKDFRRI